MEVRQTIYIQYEHFNIKSILKALNRSPTKCALNADVKIECTAFIYNVWASRGEGMLGKWVWGVYLSPSIFQDIYGILWRIILHNHQPAGAIRNQSEIKALALKRVDGYKNGVLAALSNGVLAALTMQH